MAYRSYDVETIRMDEAVRRAVSQMSSILAAQGAQINGSLPPDPRTGGYEDADGNWIEYFKVGMPLASAPMRPEQD